jgi:putative endopeptidase
MLASIVFGSILAASGGIDLDGMDPAVKPGDDFYRHANGRWEKTAEIPADRSSWGPDQALTEKTSKETREILEAKKDAPAGSEAKKVGDYYATFMDEALIEKKGLTPLLPELSRIQKIKDKKGLVEVIGDGLRADVDPLNNTNFHTSRLFGFWFAPDLNAPNRVLPYILQGGLGLPDREYYLDPSPKMADVRKKYEAHVARVFALARTGAGPRPAEVEKSDKKRAAKILALETKIATAHAPRVDSEDVKKSNNPWPRSEFSRRAPGMEWNALLAAARLDKVDQLIVWHPSAIAGLAKLVKSEPLEVWKDWLLLHAIDRASPYLSKAFVDENFDFFARTLLGVPELRERWKRAIDATNDALPDAVGKLYVERHFPPEAKAKAEAMVKNIVAAFGVRIDRVSWMAETTKKRAKEKLATLYVGVGYPETWRDYASLEIVPGDALGNAERGERYDYAQNLAKLAAPVDKRAWAMTPQTVNAVNLPIQNALNFPAAILQQPYFEPDRPEVINYGEIGAVIGHEISHSFDDQGAQFDAQGKLENWWTPSDLEQFEAAGKKLAAQFDAYAPFPDLHVRGQQTLSENIADLSGLEAALDAWHLSIGNKVAPKSQGFTGEQLFFIAYAQSWRIKMREAEYRQRLITDGHAPPEFRVHTVRNVDAWYAAFDVKPGQAPFLPPASRVHIW